ncbi:hypothetical protein AAC387_Pa02g0635 [Persea americana]
MAETSNVISSHHISKEVQRIDGSIPLSPQWLLPKPGENKPGMEPHSNSHPSYASHADAVKALERDARSTIRRDRWREVDKEVGDTRKTEQWTDSSSTRHSSEARRVPSERWTESGNREGRYDQRRESKWNKCWDRVTKSQKERVDREGDHYSRSRRSNSSVSRGRAELPHHQTLTPNKQVSMYGYGRGRGENAIATFSVGRGRVSSSGNTINKNPSHSSLGILSDKAEGTQGDSSSTLRYSRTNLLDIYRMIDVRTYVKPLDGLIEVPSLTQMEPLKPLALFAPTPEELVVLEGIDKGDVVSSGAPQASIDGSTGSSEDFPSGVDDYIDEKTHNIKDCRIESIPLKKVDQEVANREVDVQERPSGKRGILWRSQSLMERSHGSLHNWQDSSSDIRLRSSDLGWSQSQKDHRVESDNRATSSLSYYQDEPSRQDSQEFQSDTSSDSIIKQQSFKILDGERVANVRLVKGDSFTYREKTDVRKLLPEPSPENLSLYYKDPLGEIQGPFSGSDMIGWLEAGYFSVDLQVRLASASPATPFSLLGDVMPHLKMKARPPPGFSAPKQSDTAEASGRVKFNSLGKTHSGLAEVDLTRSEQRYRHELPNEAENRFLESLMSGNVSSPLLETFPFIEGYAGTNSARFPPVGAECGSDLNSLLAQRMSQARQSSLTNHLPYWPARDPAPLASQAEISLDTLTSQSKLLTAMLESPQMSHPPQHVDLRSIPQAVASNSSPAVRSGVATWSDFPDVISLSNSVQSGKNILQDKMDKQHNQHFAPPAGYGLQQQRLQPHHQPSLPHTITQPVDHSSGVVTPEKLVPSGIAQDPQILSILQQQYLLSQLQAPIPAQPSLPHTITQPVDQSSGVVTPEKLVPSGIAQDPQILSILQQQYLLSQLQAPIPAQLSVFDKLLLLMQQQQKQGQQQFFLQQQQHLPSPVPSEHQIHKQFIEPSYGQLQTAIQVGNTSADHLRLNQPHEAFQVHSQSGQTIPLSCDIHVNGPVPSLEDDQRSSLANLSSQISQDVSCTVSYGTSAIHFPHEVFENSTHQESCIVSLPQQNEDIKHKDNLLIPGVTDYSLPSEGKEKSLNDLILGKSDLVPGNLEDKVQDHALHKNAKISETITVASEAISSFVPTEESATIPVSTTAGKKKNISFPIKDDGMKVSFGDTVEKSEVQSEHHAELPAFVEVKNVDVKKSSVKKFRKQKNSRVQFSSDQGKGASKTVPLQQLKVEVETEWINAEDAQHETVVGAEVLYGTHCFEARDGKSAVSVAEASGSQPILDIVSGSLSENVLEMVECKSNSREVESELLQNTQATSGHRAWKPAPGLRVKSLLEIQQEEQRKAQKEMAVPEAPTVVNPMSSSAPTPWAGVGASSEPKTAKNIHKDARNTQFVIVMTTPSDVSGVDDHDFVEVKETKKSCKKAPKGKGAGVKVYPPVASVDLSAASVPTEKIKSSLQIEQEREMLPVPSSGPSLGDFVLWKGDPTNVVPGPSWSTDSGKLLKTTSLRDIQKEQEKKATSSRQQTPAVPPPKDQSNPVPHGSGSSWHLSGTSLSKAASPVNISSHASAQSKSKAEDDFFWGPLDQSKQQSKQSDFPSLANPYS